MQTNLSHAITAYSRDTTLSLVADSQKPPAEDVSSAKTGHTPILTSESSFVALSEEAQFLAKQDANKTTADSDEATKPEHTTEATTAEKTTEEATEETTEESSQTKDKTDSAPLTEEEQQQVTELQARDQEVRTHEQAHAAAGGQYAGSPSYSFEQGPDGIKYAVDGEVSIDVSEISGDPRATISKMQQVYQAALAPAQPSAADRSVASTAQSKIAAATAELNQAPTQSTQTDENSATSEANNKTSDDNHLAEPKTPQGIDNTTDNRVKNNPYQTTNTTTGGIINQLT